IGRWEKRGGNHIEQLDPTRIDVGEWHALVDKYGGARFGDELVRPSMLAQSDNPPAERDDFRATGRPEARGLARTSDRIFCSSDRFFLGCEAGGGRVGWAFAADVKPFGAGLQPVPGSDIGHWDVGDMREVVPEAYELLDDGRLDAHQFRAFACDNPIRLHARM